MQISSCIQLDVLPCMALLVVMEMELVAPRPMHAQL